MTQRNWYGEQKRYTKSTNKDTSITGIYLKAGLILLASFFYLYFIILGRTI
jgi:hypothetical protein